MSDNIKKLESLGFTNYESKVFTVLMKGHNMTASEIANEAKIPRTSVYEILKSFTEKGICNEITTPSKLRYEMIDPDIVEDKIEKEINSKYKNQLDELQSSFKSLKSIYKSQAQKDSLEKIELLKGFNKHRNVKFLDILNESSEEILFINRLQGTVYTEQDKAVEAFYKRGGILKSIYEVSTNFRIKFEDKWEDVTQKGLVKLCTQFEKDGAKVRLTDSVPQLFTVFDTKIVFLSVIDNELDKHNRTDIIIRDENYARSMKDLFELYWSKSYNVKEFDKSKIKS